MQSLSYADRERILAIREQACRSAPSRSDEEIVREVSTRLYEHVGKTGFEFCFTRYALALAYELLFSDERAIKEISRGALLYFLKQDDLVPDNRDVDGLEDDYYVMSLAIHEIEERSGEISTYSGPHLNEEHHRNVIEMLNNFAERPPFDDATLIEQSRQVVTGLKPIASAGFFGRFVRSIDHLVGLISSADSEQQKWARAGLSYLIETEDLIPDDLGLVGYLDDRVAVFEANRRCGASSGLMIAALDEVVGQWPFLLRTVLSDIGGDHELSEFMLLNCSIVQQTETAGHGLRWLSLPRTGLAPGTLAMLAAIGFLCDREYSDDGWLSVESKVHLDGDRKAVYLYRGLRTRDGREEFGLCHKVFPNGRPRATVWFPAIPENLTRMSPASNQRKVRGPQPEAIQRSNAAIRPIDRLLNSRLPIASHVAEKTTVLISRPAHVKAWSERVSLYGVPLKDLLPIANLAADGSLKWWSNRWENLGLPSILVVSDPLEAADWLADQEKEASVIVDVGSLSRDKVTDLVHLANRDASVVAILADADIESCDFATNQGSEVVGWGSDELRELIWRRSRSDAGILQEYESSVLCAVRGTVKAERIDCSEVDHAWLATKELARVAGANPTDEMDSLLNAAWRLLRTLSQWPFLMSSSVGLREYVSLHSSTLRQTKSVYLAADAVASAARAADRIDALVSRLTTDNPKFAKLEELLEGEPATLVMPSRLAAADAKSAAAISDRILNLSVADWRGLDPGSVDHVIVPGWYRSEIMNRLLNPLIATRVTVLAYGFESDEHRRFLRRATRRRFSRSIVGKHRSVSVPAEPVDMPPEEETVESVENFERLVRMYARKRAEAQVSGSDEHDRVEAQLILFEDDSCVWVTDYSRLRRVNHLLAGLADDESELEVVSADELRVGDYLLFHLGSDPDAIRVQADEVLPRAENLRESASLWKEAIRSFLRGGGDESALIQRLREAGCARQLGTLNAWIHRHDIIAPRSYRDIRAIATATADVSLEARIEECIDAVSQIRSAHMRASRMLAQRVIGELLRKQTDDPDPASAIELGDSLRIVRVVATDRERTLVPHSCLGRLLEGELR